MSDDNELNPEIEAALKDVPTADSSLRELHIAAALAEMTPARSPGRLKFLAAAAAVLVLVGGGIVSARSSDSNSPIVVAPDSTLTTIAKGATECSEELSGLVDDSSSSATSFMRENVEYIAIGQDGRLQVYLAQAPCTSQGEIRYQAAMETRDKKASVDAQTAECTFLTEPIARFEDMSAEDSYKLVLVADSEGVSLYFEDRCNEPIGSILLP